MRYSRAMDARRALDPPSDDFVDQPISAADWAAMSASERAFLQVGIDELDRDEVISNDAMQAYFATLLDHISKQ